MKKLILAITLSLAISTNAYSFCFEMCAGGSASGGASSLAELSDWPAAVSATEVGYLDGLTDTLINLLAAKSATTHNHDATYLGIAAKAADADTLDSHDTSYFQTAISFGANVQNALGIDIGSAGAPVLYNGALGTPSSGTLTNCTFPTLNQNTTGSAATLTTARTIGGVSFNGSANIDLPGVNTAGNQNTSGTAANATNVAVTDDTSTNATMYLLWVTTTTGNLPAKISSTKLSFNPSTGVLSASAGIQAGSSTGVSATGSNGTIAFLGLGDGNDEGLTWDYNTTSNTVGVSSVTGVTLIDFGTIGLATTGIITGGAATPVIDDPDNFAANFTGRNLYGGEFVANAAGTIVLPEATIGMNFTISLEGANAVVVDPLGTGTADTIVLNGLAATADENITSSTSGAECVFRYRAANSWKASCNGFAEASPP